MAKDANDHCRENRSGNEGNRPKLDRRNILLAGTTLAAASALGSATSVQTAQAQPAPSGQRPNIIVIMGDDIGWSNIGVYNQGIMAGRTPNLDRMASEGMRFTDYYAEASCTAGRANFITGELPIRTGLTTVGQAGAATGMPAQAPTIATALKSMGYATGQFGKNHLGDRNEFLPTVHGFDEYWGYLYHLDAMEDPFHPNYPQALLNTVGPRNLVHSAWRAMLTIRLSIRVGAKWASKKSRMRGHCRHIRCQTSSTTWKLSMRSFATRRWSSSAKQGSKTNHSSYGSIRRVCTS